MTPPVQLLVEPGQRFGRGVIIEETRIPRRGQATGYRAARLICDCGEEYVTALWHLLHGEAKSCGRHDQSSPTHRLSSHPLYHTWWNMIRRCEDPRRKDYHRYGGRGIRVCDRWHDVSLFIADIERWLGPRPAGYSLDRIQPDHDYRLDNVRWATAKQQRANHSAGMRAAA